MKTDNLIKQIRKTRCETHDMISECHHCAKKMYEFIGTQDELMGLCTLPQFASYYEVSKSILKEMEEHCNKLEEIRKVIEYVLEYYECEMPLLLEIDE